jgi:hypothetical protein
MRTLLRALRCIGLLDSASFSHAAAPARRAFNNRDASYAMHWSAASDCDEPAASPARRRQALQGKRTLMSNAAFSGAVNNN